MFKTGDIVEYTTPSDRSLYYNPRWLGVKFKVLGTNRSSCMLQIISKIDYTVFGYRTGNTVDLEHAKLRLIKSDKVNRHLPDWMKGNNAV